MLLQDLKLTFGAGYRNSSFTFQGRDCFIFTLSFSTNKRPELLLITFKISRIRGRAIKKMRKIEKVVFGYWKKNGRRGGGGEGGGREEEEEEEMKEEEEI